MCVFKLTTHICVGTTAVCLDQINTESLSGTLCFRLMLSMGPGVILNERITSIVCQLI